jgi:hypothetical protein
MRAYPTTPLQYLRRLQLVNEVLSDDVRLHGVEIGPGEHDCRIVTSQPNATGEPPREPFIVEWLESFGFQLVGNIRIGAYDAKCFRRAGLWLFDVRPRNFVLGPDEHCYPIDVIVQDANDDR